MNTVVISDRRGFDDYMQGAANLRAISYGLVFDTPHYIQVLDTRTQTYHSLTEFYHNFPEALDVLEDIHTIQGYIDLIYNAKILTTQEFSQYIKSIGA